MNLQSLAEIKAEVMRRACLIDAAEAFYIPNFGGYKHGGDDEFCVEVGEAGYHYFYIERGIKTPKITTDDLDELLYQIFDPITHELASDYARQHRNHHQDPRRLIFQKQVELMAVLSSKWGDRKTSEHDKILARAPFNDLIG